MESEGVNMDLWEVFYSFIGSFLGFGFALVAENIINTINNDNRITRLMDNLTDELKYIYESYYDSELKNVKKTKTYFDTPIWNSVISTGDLLVLLEKNKEYYDKVLSVYSKVYIIKKMETEDEVKYEKFIQKDKKYVIEQTKELLYIK
jgi:hypothetical protein